jgi:flavin-dependent dehydrogenase
MVDVLIVGAGPAGAVAATILARSGVRVQLLDRARFPRAKLCGDSVNPGTVALLGRLGLGGVLGATGLPIDGMILTGPAGVSVTARYPDGRQGRTLVRRELDWSLLQQALAAGAAFDPGTPVRRALTDPRRGVVGVCVDGGRSIRARVVIAADGRRSTLAFELGVARHPSRPRRWAVGAYFAGARPAAHPSSASSFGEMHFGRTGYVGVAPLPDGLTNACLVTGQPPASAIRNPEALLRGELDRIPTLRDRFAGARLAGRPVVLGPLAVDVADPGIDGLLLAGDAAGFIDPMTGDGLRFAVRGGELAAQAALRALERGWSGVHAELAGARRRDFAAKWRFNRTLRALVSSSAAIRASEAIASVAPPALRLLVRTAGDC